MAGSAIVAGNGVVLIEIPAGGLTGEVLTKQSNEDFDFDWAPGGGGGGGDVLTLTIPGGVFTLTQSSGVSPLTVDLVGGLSGAFLYKPGFAGGQDAAGGTAAGDGLTLRGSNSGGADVGRIDLDSPVEFFYSEGNTTPAEQSVVRWRPTFTTAGAYIGGWFLNNATITYTNAFYIYSSIQDNSIHISNAAAGFQAWTLFNALCSIRRGTSNALVQAITLNDGVNHTNATANPATTIQHVTVSATGSLVQSVAGGSMVATTGFIGLAFSPRWNCVAGGTVDLNDCYAISVTEPTVALFGTNAGTRRVNNISAINWPNMTVLTGYILDGEIAVIRSAQSAGASRFFLRHTGTAISTLAGQMRFDADLVGVTFGASQDVQLGWGSDFLFTQFNALADQYRLSNPDADRFLIEGAVDSELTLHFPNGISMGGDSGALGNSFVNIVGDNLTPGAAGDYSGVLLTHASNYNNNALARGRVAAWVINGFSYNADSGSVTNSDTLTVGGMVTSSPGVTITNRQSLFVIAGRSRHASIMQYDPITPAALGAGDTDDYAGLLTGTANNGMRGWARMAGDAGGTSALTGIDATFAQDGDTVKFTNVSANNITLRNQNAGSAAANRIITGTGADLVLGADEECFITYDATTARWRVGART